MEDYIKWLSENWVILAPIIIGAASAIAKATPNETDNKFVATLQRVVDFLALSTGKTEYKKRLK